MPDMVNHPPHYTFSNIEVIDVLEAWGLGYHEACAVKYIARAKHKGNEKQDLEKAKWYIERKLEQIATAEEPNFVKCKIPNCVLRQGHSGNHYDRVYAFS